MGVVDIGTSTLVLSYLLLIFPVCVILWYRIQILSDTLIAILRMTVQLLFVGLYLQVVFEINSIWLTALWLTVMITVADVSIIRSCRLRFRKFIIPLFISLLAGAAIPLLFFTGIILHRQNLLDAQYAIPIGGMILGNCLRGDIIGIREFYTAIRSREKQYQLALTQGATLSEATRPFIRDACQAALLPTVATMATIGLVALPGMMTGVILGGADPMVAIKYQIAIMIAIFSGTTITVALAIWLTIKSSFDSYGILDRGIFKS